MLCETQRGRVRSHVGRRHGKTSRCHCSICYAWIFLDCMHTFRECPRREIMPRAAWKLQFKISEEIKHVLRTSSLNKIETILLFYIDIAIKLLPRKTRVWESRQQCFFDSRVSVIFCSINGKISKKLISPFYMNYYFANSAALKDQNWLN